MKKQTLTKTPPTQATDTPAEGDTHVLTNNLGRGIHRRELEKFAKLDDKEKHTVLKETWKEIAMGAALRAKAFITTCAPKDFNNLYRMVMAGAVAIDKAYPPVADKKPPVSPSLVVNMFGSLGQRAAKIAMPETPETTVIDVTSVPVSTPVTHTKEDTDDGTLHTGG